MKYIEVVGIPYSLACFYRFPIDPELHQKWVVMVGRRQTSGSLWQPGATSCLCSKHFDDSDFEFKFGQRKLKSGTVPTKFCHRPEPYKRKPRKERQPPVIKRLRSESFTSVDYAASTSTAHDISVTSATDQDVTAAGFDCDIHNYALQSPRKLSKKLQHVVKLATGYKKKFHNTRQREHQLRGKISDLLSKLRQHQVLSSKAEELMQAYTDMFLQFCLF